MGDQKLKKNVRTLGAILFVCLLLGSPLSIILNPEPVFGMQNLNSSHQAQGTHTIITPRMTRETNDNNNWTMYMGNNQNTGMTDTIVPNINHTIWIYSLKDINDNPIPIFSSPIVYGEQVFVGADNHKMYSFDKLTGELNWVKSLDGLVELTSGPIESTPTIYNDKLYFGSDDTNLYCLNTSDGGLNWSFKLPHYIKSSPKIANNTVITCSYGNPGNAKIFALNATTGAEVWNYTGPGEGNFHSTPAIENGIAYFGYEPLGVKDNRSTIYAFYLNNGTLVWDKKTSNGIYSTITVANNKILFGDLNGKIYALNMNNGSEVWNRSTGDKIYSSPGVDSDNNVVYIGSDDGDIYSLNINTGTEYWRYPVKVPGGSKKFRIQSPIIVAQNKLLFGALNNKFYCINSSTADLTPSNRFIWSLDTGGYATCAAAPINGLVYITSESGKIFAFGNPDLEAALGKMVVSEDSPYVGETIEISGEVFNNGSLDMSGTVGFYLHISFSAGQGPPEKILVSSNDITLAVSEKIVLKTSTTITDRDWSIVTNIFLLLEITNTSYEESKVNNNLDIEILNVLEYYDQDWLSFQRNDLNSGLGDSASLTNKSIWSYDINTITPGNIVSSPLFGKGRIFVGSTSGSLFSILDSGPKLDWEFKADGQITSTPAILMNRAGSKKYEKIAFGTQKGNVYALDINKGSLNWSYDTAGSIQGSPLIMFGVVYISTASGELYAFDEDGFHDGDQGLDDTNESKSNGDILWKKTLPSGIKSAPAFHNNTLYAVITSPTHNALIALDWKTGNSIWSYNFDSVIQGSPVIDETAGFIYIGVDDNKLYALDLDGLYNGNQGLKAEQPAKNNNADIIWSFDSGSKIPEAGSVDNVNSRLIFGTESGYVYALNSKTGSKYWEFKGAGKFISPPTIANGYVFAPSDNGILYCIKEFPENISSKVTTQIWQFSTGTTIKAPALCDNFATYVVTETGIIHKLGAPNKKPSAIIDSPNENDTYFIDEKIILNGSSSFDPEDGKNLTYLWKFKPADGNSKFTILYNRTTNPMVMVQLNKIIKNPGDYIINLTVIDSYEIMSWNITNITIFAPEIGYYKNESIPAWCSILFSGFGGIDLYSTHDPWSDGVAGSVGNISKFINLYYFTYKPLYRVGWYNVSIGYLNADLPEEYNISRVRMYRYNENTNVWEKLSNSGIDLTNKLVWANLSGNELKPMTYQLFAPGTFDNSPPTIELHNKGVAPFNGTRDETYDYIIKYFDFDSDLPISSNGGYIQIVVNNKPYDLIEVNINDTDPTDGKFYTFTLSGGDLRPSNSFKIRAHDGTYLFETREFSGPNVTFGSSPVADAGQDKTEIEEKTFWLDASASFDLDDDIAKYLWDTDNDGDFNDSGGSKEGMKVSWKFDDPGIYTVTLMVIDEDGNFDTDSITVTVRKKDADGGDGDFDALWLYIGLFILIIIIIIVVIALIYSSRLREERDKKAFLKGEEVEEVEGDEELAGIGTGEIISDEEAEEPEPIDDEIPDEESELEDIEEDEFSEDLAEGDETVEDVDEEMEMEELDLEEEPEPEEKKEKAEPKDKDTKSSKSKALKKSAKKRAKKAKRKIKKK